MSDTKNRITNAPAADKKILDERYKISPVAERDGTGRIVMTSAHFGAFVRQKSSDVTNSVGSSVSDLKKGGLLLSSILVSDKKNLAILQKNGWNSIEDVLPHRENLVVQLLNFGVAANEVFDLAQTLGSHLSVQQMTGASESEEEEL